MSALTVVGKVLEKIFGSRNERLVRRYSLVADRIGELEPELRGQYDEEFISRIEQLQKAGDLPLEVNGVPLKDVAFRHDFLRTCDEALACRVQEVRRELSLSLIHI